MSWLQAESIGRLQHATNQGLTVSRRKLIYITRSIFKKFPEFAGIATVNKEMYIDIIRRLRDAVRGNVPQNGKPTVAFYFTMLQHTGRLWSRIS
jgi:hypothetical protein